MERFYKFLLLVIFLYSSLSSLAQGKSSTNTQLTSYKQIDFSSEVKPLAIGDHMPDISLSMMNYSKGTAKISDFKGKLILLDFWATWCGACVSAFPKLTEFQKKFGSRFQVILVNSEGTGDNKDRIAQFMLKRSANKQPISLPIATNDKIAVQLFPHSALPHYAWITPQGVVKAVTSSKEVTDINIEKILNEEQVQLTEKRDLFRDKISGYEENMPIDNTIAHFSFLKRGRMDGWRSLNFPHVVREGDVNVIRGMVMRNIPLLEIYETAVGFNPANDIISNDPKRMIVEVIDSSILFKGKSGVSNEEWDKQNLFSYDIVVPTNQSRHLSEYILEDLNRYSGFYGRLEKRKIKCLLLIISQSQNSSSKAVNSTQTSTSSNAGQTNSLVNMPASYVAKSINKSTSIKLPIIDRTNNASKSITIDIEKNDNIESIRRKLNAIELDLVESEEQLEMFILTQNP